MEFKTINRRFMSALFGFVILLTCGGTFAMTGNTANQSVLYHIQSKIYLDKKLVASPRIMTRANQRASISLSKKDSPDNLTLSLVASDAAKTKKGEPIRIKFDVRYANGKEKLHSNPQIIVLPNQMGGLSFSSDKGHVFEVQVIATRGDHHAG
jgi:hypothetical protein